jgi:hypothetical protein
MKSPFAVILADVFEELPIGILKTGDYVKEIDAMFLEIAKSFSLVPFDAIRGHCMHNLSARSNCDQVASQLGLSARRADHADTAMARQRPAAPACRT